MARPFSLEKVEYNQWLAGEGRPQRLQRAAISKLATPLATIASRENLAVRSLQSRHRALQFAHHGPHARRSHLPAWRSTRATCSHPLPKSAWIFTARSRLPAKATAPIAPSCLGCSAKRPATLDPDTIDSKLEAIRLSPTLSLLGRQVIPFREAQNIVFHRDQMIPPGARDQAPQRYPLHRIRCDRRAALQRDIFFHRRRLHRRRRSRRERRADDDDQFSALRLLAAPRSYWRWRSATTCASTK